MRGHAFTRNCIYSVYIWASLGCLAFGKFSWFKIFITRILDSALLLQLLSSRYISWFRDIHCVISLFWLIIYNRVSIWPPPQRAAASAIVHPDRPTHHEPDEWGRGWISPFCCLGFRWVSAHSNKTMIWDQFLFAILFPQQRGGLEIDVAMWQCQGSTSLFHRFVRQ